jgi:hypothetical protein
VVFIRPSQSSTFVESTMTAGMWSSVVVVASRRLKQRRRWCLPLRAWDLDEEVFWAGPICWRGRLHGVSVGMRGRPGKLLSFYFFFSCFPFLVFISYLNSIFFCRFLVYLISNITDILFPVAFYS